MAVKRAERAGVLHPLSFRVTPELKAKLDASASANGRSVTAEIQSRLEQSFTQEDAIEHLTETLRQSNALLNEMYQAKILSDSRTIKVEGDEFATISAIDLDTVIQRTVGYTLQSIAMAHAPSSEEGREYRDAMAGVLALAAQKGMGHIPLPLPSFDEWKAERVRSKAEEYYEPPDEPQGNKAAKRAKGKSRAG